AACADFDGQMAAEVFNYRYALKNPRGATYTFGVHDLGTPVAPVAVPPVQFAQPAQFAPQSNSPGNRAPMSGLSAPPNPIPIPRPPTTPPTLTSSLVRPATSTPFPPTITPSPSPSPSPTPSETTS